MSRATSGLAHDHAPVSLKVVERLLAAHCQPDMLLDRTHGATAAELLVAAARAGADDIVVRYLFSPSRAAPLEVRAYLSGSVLPSSRQFPVAPMPAVLLAASLAAKPDVAVEVILPGETENDDRCLLLRTPGEPLRMMPDGRVRFTLPQTAPASTGSEWTSWSPGEEVAGLGRFAEVIAEKVAARLAAAAAPAPAPVVEEPVAPDAPEQLDVPDPSTPDDEPEPEIVSSKWTPSLLVELLGPDTGEDRLPQLEDAARHPR